MGNLLTNYEDVAAVILFVIGMGNLLLQTNLVKKIIGLDIMDSAVYLFLASKGYIEGARPPSTWTASPMRPTTSTPSPPDWC